MQDRPGFIRGELWPELKNAGSMQRDIIRGFSGGLMQREVANLGTAGNVARTFGSGMRTAGSFVGQGLFHGGITTAQGASYGVGDMYGMLKKSRAAGREQFIAKRAKVLAEGGEIGFSLRTGGEHLARGTKNYLKYGVLNPAAWGLNFMIAASMTGDNPTDPSSGMPRAMANAVGAEAGFFAGSTLGAAAAAALVPGGAILAAGAWLLGGMVGAGAGEGVTDIPWKLSEFGRKYGSLSVAHKSSFLDSEQAATMRQRAMQSIRRNQLNARSSFGSEALAYHY